MNVGVRGDDTDVRGVLDAVDAAVAPEDDDALDAVLAVGEAGLRSIATDPPEVPVLPVIDGGGRHVVDRSALCDSLAAVDAGEGHIDTHPVLRVRRDGTIVGRLLRDVVLVTATPASISEYAVAGDGTATSVRADGIVVATPIGSDGYAAAAGGPVLDATTGVVVVPVAPFSTGADTTVVDPDTGLALSVVRDGEIALFLDGVRHGSVGVGADLRIERVDSVALVSTRTENF
ncbi:ATP-NAD kinase [Haloplanus salilacus]|uniref:ATP-NAD kinase n=1 Tax=Haloplanus salilacus TaxID=2949994 RepID=UPI0030D3F2F6